MVLATSAAKRLLSTAEDKMYQHSGIIPLFVIHTQTGEFRKLQLNEIMLLTFSHEEVADQLPVVLHFISVDEKAAVGGLQSLCKSLKIVPPLFNQTGITFSWKITLNQEVILKQIGN